MINVIEVNRDEGLRLLYNYIVSHEIKVQQGLNINNCTNSELRDILNTADNNNKYVIKELKAEEDKLRAKQEKELLEKIEELKALLEVR